MSRSSILALTFAIVLGFTSCGGETHEALANESIDLMEDFTDSLAKIDDKASAQKQAGELERLVAKMKDVQARMEKLGDPSEEQGAELAQKLEQGMGAAMQKMTKELMRIGSNPEIMSVVGPLLEKLDQ